MRKLCVLVAATLALAAGKGAKAQEITPHDLEKLHTMEDSLVVTADSMYEAFLPDTHVMYSERFARQLVRALKIPNSYLYPFDSIKQVINIIYADDRSFRMFNWAIAPTSSTKRYYGAIQLPQEKLKLYGLQDYSEQAAKGGEDSVLTGGKWFGNLCYRIMAKEVQGRKMYMMFGYNAASPISNKKILDPLTIDERGLTFGYPVFAIASEANQQQRINRFILEYKKDVQVGMNWDQERGMVVFDKLVSQANDPHRKYTLVPSGQYDGLHWANDTWSYVRDIMPITILKDGEAPSDPPSDTR